MNKFPLISALVLVFVLGWIVSSVYSSYPNQEVPFPFITLASSHKSAPFDRISDSQIYLNNKELILSQSKLSLAHYAPTGSMLPFLTEGHTGIEIPASETEIHIGDIVAYKPIFPSDILVVHQVVDIRENNGNKCYIMKGFNNLTSDGCVPEDQLEFVLVGILF